MSEPFALSCPWRERWRPTSGELDHGEGGLTPAEALAAATSVPARIFGLPDRGRVAPGLRADVLLVKGDPTVDIKSTRAIARVWKQGVAVDREGYRSQITMQVAGYERQLQTPPPAGFESGVVSDFEQEQVKAGFGFGWQISTDSMMGGQSRAEMKATEGGAEGSDKSLLITGEVVSGAPFPWAGAMFYPGPMPMAPANLSSKPKITFWAKGDGATYQLMFFAQSLGWQPARRSFSTSREWKQYRFELSQFNGIDGRDVTGVFFGASEPGSFALRVDDVRFEK